MGLAESIYCMECIVEAVPLVITGAREVGSAVSLIAGSIGKLVNLIKDRPSQPTPMPSGPNKTDTKLRADAQKELGIDTEGSLNFAFVGETGVGKSSLINAIRGITKQNHPDAAPTGTTDTTKEIICYRDPKYPHVCYWDFPGSGTIQNPSKTYWNDKKLYAFDHILIISAARLLDFDINIAQCAKVDDVPVTFIRTKMDVDIENEIEEDGSCDLKKMKNKLHTTIIEKMQNDFHQQGINNPDIFLINKKSFNPKNRKAAKYMMDEMKLLERILQSVKERRYRST